MAELGKILLVTGLLLAGLGLLFMALNKFPSGWRVPGDIFIKKENFSFYFPLGTCILLSLLLSFIFQLFHRR